MTSSANDDWDYEKLKNGIRQLEWLRCTVKDKGWVGQQQEAAYRHTIDFIEYNMRELEITASNGD